MPFDQLNRRDFITRRGRVAAPGARSRQRCRWSGFFDSRSPDVLRPVLENADANFTHLPQPEA
jgi:hypothetical protein